MTLGGVVVSSDQESEAEEQAGFVQLVRLVHSVQLTQPAPAAPPVDDGPDCEYSACRWELPALQVFDNDLDKQKKPIVGFHVTGSCPRCGHATSALFPVAAVVMEETGPWLSPSVFYDRAVGQGRLSAWRYTYAYPNTNTIRRRPIHDPEKVKVSALTCQCTKNHKNSKDAFGCGASWLIGATFDLGTKKITKAELSAVDDLDAAKIWPAAEAYATTVTGSLKAVQSSAKGWQAALTAILGLVAVISLVGGRSTLQALSGATQTWIVVLAGIAIAANAWGIFMSTLATIGFPVIKRGKSALDLSNSDLWPLQQTIHAVSNLRTAMFSSGIAFLAAAGAIGLVWLAPNAAPAPVTVNLMIRPTPSPGVSAAAPVAVCGVLPTAQPTGSPASIAIVPSSSATPAPTVTYPMTSVVDVAPGTC